MSGLHRVWLLRGMGWLGLVAVLAGGAPATAAEPPPPPKRSDVERALAAASEAAETSLRPLTVVLLADEKDHGPDEHDYPLWRARWALLLGGAEASSEAAVNLYGPDRVDPEQQEGAADVRVIRAHHWPDADQWAAADLVAVFGYMPWNAERLEEVERFLARGGGLVLIHSANWTRPEPSPEVAELTGSGGFQFWRHGEMEIEIVAADHPICRGLPATILWVDEPYWPPTPLIDDERLTVLAVSRERIHPEQPAEGPQPQFWAYQQGEGRVFGCVPGHYVWTFDDPYFRILLLRGMAWAAGTCPHRFDPLVLRGAAVADD